MNAVIYEVYMVLAIAGMIIYSGPLAVLLDLISMGCWPTKQNCLQN